MSLSSFRSDSALALPFGLRPHQIFWLFALFHFLLWVIIPAATGPNVQLDVIEGYAWGHEWPMGTYKHPPLQAWILEIFAQITNRAVWASYIASQLAIVTAFWAVWKTGRRILNEEGALIGVMMLEGVIYFTYTSTEFNPNVLQLPFWALIGWSYHKAVKENRLIDWALLGLWAAGGLYTKYSTALLVICLAILTVAHRETRPRLLSPGPYLAALIMLGLFMPHLHWLVKHDFQPIVYMQDRMNMDAEHLAQDYLRAPFILIFGQLVALLPITLLAMVFIGEQNSSRQRTSDVFDRWFLHTVTFGPFALTGVMALAIGFKVHDMWGAPFWDFIGLWILYVFKPSLSPGALRRFAYFWLIVTIATPVIYGGVSVLYPYVTGRGMRIHFAGRHLAENITPYWHHRFHTKLSYAIGDTWPAGNLAFYTPDRPHVFINHDPTISPWIDINDFHNKGGVAVWCIRYCASGNNQGRTPDYVQSMPNVEIQQPLLLERHSGANLPEVVMGWAIVPPQNASNTDQTTR
ncbi:MAG: glycosyltransferase family 39 protein [Alphaproteobacteria bacterium]|nr:glycosyltransferase family 39 protein [Alphaproteobacteria bacterium]MBV8548738.1 glycosyltransferase family 39 protein [Alphaproteobacteria bacterium]